MALNVDKSTLPVIISKKRARKKKHKHLPKLERCTEKELFNSIFEGKIMWYQSLYQGDSYTGSVVKKTGTSLFSRIATKVKALIKKIKKPH